ncbi:helix-turn-helix transcriptional regulator [Streptomyces sp. NBC_01476]|uniref:helix-turn-helix domain-containing protein n=1 Tax=Streptomyces sp. NBC_01476 TaxID=2903881 RepID=UPI002E32314F|nr:helix-turn-helix transcriptional regulator [Streptomyces sp. NBC_01476]
MANRNPKIKRQPTTPTMSSRAMYGAELRFKREQAGLSQEELGAALFLSRSHIARFESGSRRLPVGCAEVLDELLDAGGFFQRNLEAGRATPYPEHFADVAELETLALSIREWEPLVVPGLLQTEAYALAVIRGWDPVLNHAEVKKRLDARVDRARLFDNADKPMYWAVLNEATLRCPVGGPEAMTEQLRHLAAMIRRNRVIIQVLPFSAGSHAGMEGALRLMSFEDDAPMAYLSGMDSGRLSDDPAAVKRYSLAYDLLGAAARSPEASLNLIEAVAEEYEHGTQVQPDGGDVA